MLGVVGWEETGTLPKGLLAAVAHPCLGGTCPLMVTRD